MPVPPREQESFYRCATLGLRGLDAAGAQRRYFGPEADATWSAIVGSLRPSDRLDLLVRNAAVASPAAFAPRVIFPLPGLAEDEPFGPEWEAPAGLPDRLLRDAAQPLADASLKVVLDQAAKAWGFTPKSLPPLFLAPLTPASRILAAGAGAILALAEHFQGRAGFDLGAQIVLVTASPGERQLLGLAAALLGSATAPRFLAPGATVRAAAELPTPLTTVHLVAASDDADPGAAETAATLARELKA